MLLELPKAFLWLHLCRVCFFRMSFHAVGGMLADRRGRKTGEAKDKSRVMPLDIIVDTGLLRCPEPRISPSVEIQRGLEG